MRVSKVETDLSLKDDELSHENAERRAREVAQRLLNTPPETRAEQKKRIPVTRRSKPERKGPAVAVRKPGKMA